MGAAYALGLMYESGLGRKIDLNEALKYYKEAAGDKNAAKDEKGVKAYERLKADLEKQNINAIRAIDESA